MRLLEPVGQVTYFVDNLWSGANTQSACRLPARCFIRRNDVLRLSMLLPKRGLSRRNKAPSRAATPTDREEPVITRRSELLWAAVLMAAILATAAIRIHLLEAPLERDEGEYAYAGQLILRGSLPYEHIYNMKWPGTYYAYALIEAMLGDTIAGIRLGLLAISAAEAVLVYLIARKLLDPPAAAAAGVSYAALSVAPGALAFFGHATHFVVICALAAVVLILRALEQKRLWLYFLAGLCAGLAPVMKQPGIVFTVFVAAYWGWQELKSGSSRRTMAERGAVLLAGVVVPFATVLFTVWWNGSFDTFWLWTVEYPRYYGEAIDLLDVPQAFAKQWYRTVRNELLFWIVAGFGTAALAWQPKTRRAAPFLIGLLVLSLAGVLPGRTFRTHYFILTLPAVALLVGSAAFVVRRWLGSRRPMLGQACAAGLVVIPLGASVAGNADFYFFQSPAAAVNAHYQFLPFAECVTVGNYVRNHTSPSDRIVVIGSEPQIYFYARRVAATGYVYTFSMMERQPYAHQFQEQMIREIERDPPLYFVHVRPSYSWLPFPDSDPTLLYWFNAYQQKNLKLVGVLEGREKTSVFHWDEPNMRVDDSTAIAVYRRETGH
jgi:hypothetical protein